MGISTSFMILDVLIDLLYFIIIFKYDCHALELVRTSIYNNCALGMRKQSQMVEVDVRVNFMFMYIHATRLRSRFARKQ